MVEEAETLHMLVDNFFLLVEGGETCQRGEEDADPVIGLSVQLLDLHTHAHPNTHTHSQHLDLHLKTQSGGRRKKSATSSLRSLCRKCWATWAGRMLSSRHSLCSRSSLISSTSFLACSRQRKSSRAVASNCQR